MSVVRLSLEQIQDGISECTKSCGELIKGAQHLAKLCLYEIAFSLLLLAAEERGKAILIYRTILLDKDDIAGWEKFWSDFRNHHIKLLAGMWTWTDNFFNLCWDTQFGKTIKETQRQYISDFNLGKQEGFYVIFDNNKKFTKNKIALPEYGLLKTGINAYFLELFELNKSGFFSTENLSKLKTNFSSQEGEALLAGYKKLKRLNSSPEFKKKYQEFIVKNGLCDLTNLLTKARDKGFNKGMKISFLSRIALAIIKNLEAIEKR